MYLPIHKCDVVMGLFGAGEDVDHPMKVFMVSPLHIFTLSSVHLENNQMIAMQHRVPALQCLSGTSISSNMTQMTPTTSPT